MKFTEKLNPTWHSSVATCIFMKSLIRGPLFQIPVPQAGTGNLLCNKSSLLWLMFKSMKLLRIGPALVMEPKPGGYQEYQVEHSGTRYSATCGQAHWQHCVGAEFWKGNSPDHCVQLHSPTRTTCRVFLEMLCALLQKSAAIVFGYPAAFEEEEHSVTSFQHSKGGHSLVWCGLQLENWQWPYFEQTCARCQEAPRTPGTIGAFKTWGKSKSIPAVVSLIPQTQFCCL